MKYALTEMGATRTVRTLLKINQDEGFDCPSCAWGDPDVKHRKTAEFCENGAKAVAWEATRKRVDAEFFARHSVGELNGQTDHWLESSGRLTEPMYLSPGASHYAPIGWDEALKKIASRLSSLEDPNRAVFYTSGRASNEAAFVYQLLARRLGTNNLPDCSNMCHESSGAALTETIGIGKGTVTLEDISDHSDLIVIVGQNPGTNHPRMLSALEEAKQRGAKVVAVNPLPEAGLMRFKNPQRVKGVAGGGTKLADRFLQVRVNGDLALFAGVNKELLEREESGQSVLDKDFVDGFTAGFAEAAAAWRALGWADIEELSGLSRAEISAFTDDVVASKAVIVCWAMGLTQHKNAVPTIREVTNFLLLRGNIGRPGAGPCPVRGHSNVQGDRTMGIWEKMPEAFLDALHKEFGFAPPHAHGWDAVNSIRAMREGKVDVFIGLGGNFAAATPDTAATAEGLSRCGLTVHIATKLNRSHLVHGREALILPCLGRTERDVRDGTAQFVTVEDSMSVVRASRGRLAPGSPHLRSETGILCDLAREMFGETEFAHGGGWGEMGSDYSVIRDHIAAVIPEFSDFNERVSSPGGFTLPRPPHDERRFETESGKANFTINPVSAVSVPEGHLLLQTLRSHDQFNTTVYGLDDRYRGIHGGRRVVLVSAADLASLGFSDGDIVDLVSVWEDGERRAPAFRIVQYSTPEGCAAAYFPETNVLIPLDSVADTSNTPTSKSVVIRLERQNR